MGRINGSDSDGSFDADDWARGWLVSVFPRPSVVWEIEEVTSWVYIILDRVTVANESRRYWPPKSYLHWRGTAYSSLDELKMNWE